MVCSEASAREVLSVNSRVNGRTIERQGVRNHLGDQYRRLGTEAARELGGGCERGSGSGHIREDDLEIEDRGCGMAREPARRARIPGTWKGLWHWFQGRARVIKAVLRFAAGV